MPLAAHTYPIPQSRIQRASRSAQNSTRPSLLAPSLPTRIRFSGGDPSEKPRLWGRIQAWFQRMFSWFKPQKPLSEVPDILPPRGIKHWFQSLFKWLNPLYVINRLIARWQRQEIQKEAEHTLQQLSKLLPEEAQKVLNEPALKKIDYAKPVHQTTGIAQASHFLGPNHPTMQQHRNLTYLHILESYDIQWSHFKVARDALQNFYDGQGQTLEGVNIEVKPSRSGKQRIKISASATYDADKLLALGGSGKQGAQCAAGGFGEGAKMTALLLLRDFGATQVTFRSREWQTDFKLEKPGIQFTPNGSLRGLMVKLTPLDPPITGNSLEFETTDPVLAATFKGGHALFYNPSHEIFKNPLYENEVGGFKLLPDKTAPGRVYEAGQLRAFENEENYDAIPGLILWSKTKILDLKDRDRVALQGPEVKQLLDRVIAGMSLEQTAQGIQVLRDHWFYKKPEDVLDSTAFEDDNKKAAEILLYSFCEHYAELRQQQQKPTQPGEEPPKLPPADFLPKGLVAVSPRDFTYGETGKEQLKQLYKDGFLPVKPALQQLGIPTGTEVIRSQNHILETQAQKVTNLSPREQRQVNVLTTSLHTLSQAIQHQAQQANYHRMYSDELKKVKQLGQLPVEVVKLPNKANQTDPFIKISQDQHRLLVDQATLANQTLPDTLQALLNLAKDKYWYAKDATISWLLGNPAQWQTLKTDWEKQD